MVTYVNTVLVSNTSYSNAGDTLWVPTNGHAEPATTDAGKFIVMTMDENGGVVVDSTVVTPYLNAEKAATAKTMRVGIITNKTTVLRKADGTTSQIPVIKWSAVIKQNNIKSYTSEDYAADTEDVVYIDVDNLDSTLLGKLDDGGKRIIVRITYKDLPTRFRKWTESYEYVTKVGDTKPKIAAAIANMINKEWKRARVSAVVGALNTTEASNTGVVGGKYFHTDSNWGTSSATTGNVVQITAMPYDDDDAVKTLNWAAKVRFNVNMYYTDPEADGWASKNKMFLTGVEIKKVPGKQYVGSAKLVRDREAQAMGYEGILNHGNGTWPIIEPDMTTVLTNHYKTLTLEFENMYRAADDIQRHTKQNLEIYAVANAEVKAVIDAFVGGEIGTKVTKVAGTANNFVAFDSNGAIKDSGKKASDFSAA
jgi:hypothetical protein